MATSAQHQAPTPQAGPGKPVMQQRDRKKARKMSDPSILDHAQDIVETCSLAWSTGAFVGLLGPLLHRVFGESVHLYAFAAMGASAATLMSASALYLVIAA
eukprot:CAMPEP_0184316494 /NCGR_PEP_ID=MMETSP1049-20130417/90454_1 /TAXON_ID=77928 /ORGANISM="Proteomonas sulcata, Strain CCMP704" /LENGTH=100 /DNA_ID=CAMNT_0026635485 /DNA_START=347 /DNA_END=649 /DNA_ORIENTATION=+